MSCCSTLTCSDICRCITLESANGSIIIGNSDCTWDLRLNTNLIADVTATFDNVTRQLCIYDHGVVKSCVTIPDSDDQYLSLTGTILAIHKSNGTIVNSIDLAPIIPVVPPETPFVLSSTSLVVTPGGFFGHSPNIELIPSSDVNNALILGSDSRPYVPAAAAAKDIIIDAADCISFIKVVTPTAITFTPVVDFNCMAANICPLCVVCLPPNIIIDDIQATSFRLFVTNLAVGDTYDVSLDGGLTFVKSGQQLSPIIISGLTQNTTYSVVVRHNCATGGSASTNLQSISTPALLVCDSVTNVVITYGTFDFATSTYPVTISWDPVPNAVSYTVTDINFGVITTTAPKVAFSLPASTPFSGTIQTNCGAIGTSTPVPYSDTTPNSLVCPQPTNLTVTIS